MNVDRFRMREEEEVFTSKIGLTFNLANPGLKDPIVEIVKRMTRISFEGSRLVNLLVLFSLENGLEVPILSYENFLRLPFFAVTGCPTSHDQLNYVTETYGKLRGVDTPWTDGSHLEEFISMTAFEYERTCKNHVVDNLPSRLTRFMSCRLESALGEILTPIQYQYISTHLFQSLLNQFARPSLSDAETLPLPSPIFSLPSWCSKNLSPELLTLVSQCGLVIWKEVLALLDGKSVSKEAIKDSWWSYLRVLWKILEAFQEFNLKTEIRVGKGRPIRGFRLFSLLPLYHFSAKHITINTDSLHSIWCLFGFPQGINVPIQEFRDDYVNWWKRSFSLYKITSSPLTRVGWRFQFQLTTDGISTAVVWRRRKATPTNLDDYGWRWGIVDGERVQLAYVPIVVPDGVPVVGLDPGRKDLFTVSSGSGPVKNGESFGVSTKSWLELSGIKKAMDRRESWIRQSERTQLGIQNIVTDIPSSSCSSMDSLTKHIVYLTPYLDVILTFFGSRRQLRLKYSTYSTTQQAFSDLGNRITFGNRLAVIAFGDGLFASSNSGSYPSGPVKKLYNFLKAKYPNVRKIWEYRTSVVCSKCNGTLSMLKCEAWALKICKSNPDCQTIWNRDINAARNLRQLFLDMNLDDGIRPFIFSIQ